MCGGTPGGLGGTNPVDCNDNRGGGQDQCSFTAVPGFCCGDGLCQDTAGECDVCDIDCFDDPDCNGGPPGECTLGQKNDPCNTDADCCSMQCKRNGRCR